MRVLLVIAAGLLFLATMALAQDAQRTPPGGDTVGSDRPVTQNGIRSEPTASPDANQRMTQTEGSSSGYDHSPAYAGASTDNTAPAQQAPGVTGVNGQTAATAGRNRSHSSATSANGNVRRGAKKSHARKKRHHTATAPGSPNEAPPKR